MPLIARRSLIPVVLSLANSRATATYKRIYEMLPGTSNRGIKLRTIALKIIKL